jgi:hypothetical protein
MFPNRLNARTGAVVAGVLVSSVGLAVMALLTASAKSRGDEPKPPAKDEGKLKKLLQARLEVAQKIYDAGVQSFAARNDDPQLLIEPGRQLLAAQLDFFEKKEDRVSACEKHLENCAAWRDGLIKKDDEYGLQVECYRLEAEILLEREKAK